MLAYNQTANNGQPSVTQGTYNLSGGTLQANGIATGQGNGYLGGANAAPNTFTESGRNLTTTSGGTANFNWSGGATLNPFDNELVIGLGVNVTLTAPAAAIHRIPTTRPASPVKSSSTRRSPAAALSASRSPAAAWCSSTRLIPTAAIPRSAVARSNWV